MFLDTLSTLNCVSIIVLIKKSAKSMAGLVRLSRHVAEVVFSVCSSTSTVLNHSMEYNVVMSIGYYYRLELIVSKVFCNLVDSVIL